MKRVSFGVIVDENGLTKLRNRFIMFTGKRYSLLKTLKWGRKYIFYFIVINTIPVVIFQVLGCRWLMIPWQPISLVGIAVSFYLGFKNNSSYERLWEARKIWGGIVNSSRTFTIMIRDFVTNEHAQDKLSKEGLRSIHLNIIHRHVAWLNALTDQLREKREWEHHDERNDILRKAGGVHSDQRKDELLKEYISEEEFEYLSKKGNKASHIISIQSKKILELKEAGYIDDFRHMELEKLLGEFYNLQGKSERIKNFPFPRQYATVNYFFVWIFIFLLPFGMLNIFGSNEYIHLIWFCIPFTTLVSWVFYTMEMIGEYSENPFEGLYNDVPIRSMARSIEIDIRQMLDEVDLPPNLGPVGDHKVLL